MTVENFLAWKTKFDAEMEELKRQKGTLKSKKDPNKLTGLYVYLINYGVMGPMDYRPLLYKNQCGVRFKSKFHFSLKRFVSVNVKKVIKTKV